MGENGIISVYELAQMVSMQLCNYSFRVYSSNPRDKQPGTYRKILIRNVWKKREINKQLMQSGHKSFQVVNPQPSLLIVDCRLFSDYNQVLT